MNTIIVSQFRRHRRGAVLPLVMGLIFALMGAGVVWFLGFRSARRSMDVRSWKPVECTITRAELKVDTSANDPVVTPDVQYDYQRTDGKPAIGSRLEDSEAMKVNRSANDLEEMLAPLRDPGQHTCYVNPENESESVLVRPTYWVPAACIAGGSVFILIGGLVMLRPRFGRSGKLSGFWLFPLFAVLFGGAGGVCLYIAIADDSKSIAARMVEAPCEILVSRVKSETSTDSHHHSRTTWRPDVLFRYEWKGRQWHSQWPDFTKNSYSSSSISDSEEIVRRHPPRAAQTCWVDPEAPWGAVLEKTRRGGWLLWTLGSVFSLVGFGGLAGTITMLIRGRRPH